MDTTGTADVQQEPVQAAREIKRDESPTAFLDLLRIQRQMDALARSREGAVAKALASRLTPLLEPAWSIALADGASRRAIGYLRQLEIPSTRTRATVQANISVLTAAISEFEKLELSMAPKVRIAEIFRRPRSSLIDSVIGHESLALGEADAQMVGALEPAIRPAVVGAPSSFDENDAARWVRPLIRSWCDLARSATRDKRDIARLLLAAAILAREAAIQGDTDTVEWFIQRWLGFRSTSARLDGTSAALLESGGVSESGRRRLFGSA